MIVIVSLQILFTEFVDWALAKNLDIEDDDDQSPAEDDIKILDIYEDDQWNTTFKQLFFKTMVIIKKH